MPRPKQSLLEPAGWVAVGIAILMLAGAVWLMATHVTRHTNTGTPVSCGQPFSPTAAADNPDTTDYVWCEPELTTRKHRIEGLAVVAVLVAVVGAGAFRPKRQG